MGESKTGKAFVTHEFDEAIAIQQAIVNGAESLARDHSRPQSKRLIEDGSEVDGQHLTTLRRLGRQHEATGKAEGVAAALAALMEEVASSAGEAPSEAYEAEAVLITLKRKQQDSADAMVRIARETGDIDLRDAAVEFGRSMKSGADELAKDLAAFATELATSRDLATSRR